MAAKRTSRKNSMSPKAKALVKTSAQAIEKFENGGQELPYRNGLGAALGAPGMAGSGFPMNQGTYWTEQLSNVNTIFKNLRWYLISNFRQLLSEAYVELGLVQTIVDVPVDDAFRGGLEIVSKQLDEDEIDELITSLERYEDFVAAATACKWTRLFGGGAIIVITDQDPETPLDLDAIDKNTPLEFRAADMWELYFDMENTEGEGPRLDGDREAEFFSYYGVQVHKSRVLQLVGLTAPSFIRPRLRGWGVSVTERLVRSVNQYLKHADLSFEVMDEFKLDVFKIKNLTTSLMSPAGEDQIRRRVQMTNWQKNYQNAIVMDKEDEFDHKQLSFSGLAEAQQGIRIQVASDMRMPLTKLFGVSASGFNSGEDDIEVYNSMVESDVRAKIKWPLLRMMEIKCQKLFGMVPTDLRISFKSLRILGAEQEENVKTLKFNRLLSAKSAGEITRFEFREGCNKDKLLSITLDNAGDQLNPDDPDVAAITEGGENEDALPGSGDNEDDAEFSEITTGKKKKQPKPQKQAPEPKVANDIKVKPFSALQAVERAIAVRVKNSGAFDRASYAADGGDKWIDARREEFFKHPNDGALWTKSQEAARAALGEERWQFVVWFYKKHGGKFNGQ
jgi:phage-related protein (TIGR01555 family)